MKYRILYNGEAYMIQIKNFLFWYKLMHRFDDGEYASHIPAVFVDEDDAVKEMKLRYGLSATRAWSVV